MSQTGPMNNPHDLYERRFLKSAYTLCSYHLIFALKNELMEIRKAADIVILKKPVC